MKKTYKIQETKTLPGFGDLDYVDYFIFATSQDEAYESVDVVKRKIKNTKKTQQNPIKEKSF